jgi:hypothetical protein
MNPSGNIPRLFDRCFYAQGREGFDRVHLLGCLEVLDNLGYITADRNTGNDGLASGKLAEGTDRFREEYQTSSQDFPAGFEQGGEDEAFMQFPAFCKQTPEPQSESVDQLLSEEELSFLHRLSSLEGEFDLHRFSLEQISSDALLCRVLNFRMSMLGIFDIVPGPHPDARWPLCLEKLARWCGLTDHSQVFELLGDVEKLSETLTRQYRYPGSGYHHFVYFKSPVQRLIKRMQPQAGDEQRFRSRFPFIPAESIARFEQVISDPKQTENEINDELNQLMTRLVQIRLWLLGTYPGKLDNDLGPLSLEGITSLMDYFRENFGKSKGFVLSDLLMHLGGDCWALNATYLFKAFLPVLEEMNEKRVSKSPARTISEEIGNLLSDPATSPQAKESILATINKELQNESPAALNLQRKPRTRAGKGLLRSIGHFFRHVGELIGKDIKRVIRILKKLFCWFKNTARVIWCELKEIYSVMSRAITFFFSQRTITTVRGGERIVTDFDGGFDSVTILPAGAASGSELKSGSEFGSESASAFASLIQAHIRSIESHSHALTQASAFAGAIISIALKVATGPCGWIRLGAEVIRIMA